MFRSENFIYFLSVTGFFMGIIFAIVQGFEPFEFIFAVLVIFSLFYILAIASISFFIKYLSIKNIFYLDKDGLERTIDYQINELDRKEDMIREAYYFIRKIEEEELDLYHKNKGKK
jgi:low affinity Fe/Cu permease